MNPQRPSIYLEGLVRELCKLRRETEWVEFKVDNADPQAVGEYIAALANAAALAGKARGYLLWGVRDDDHAIVGTAFGPMAARKGNEELESWLLRLLAPRIDFVFHEVEVEGKHVVLLEVDRASRQPVAFRGVEYIRVGTNKKKLKDFPEKERALWRIFDHELFEEGIASEQLSAEEVLLKLDYPAYFDLVQVPLPDGRTAILDALQRERLVKPCEAGGFDITNLGAILFARRLNDFGRLGRKALRVVVYRGKGRLETEREHVEPRGYAAAFESLLTTAMTLLPAQEEIENGIRRSIPAVPEVALREIIANTLIHQDFSVRGAGPMVEPAFRGAGRGYQPGRAAGRTRPLPRQSAHVAQRGAGLADAAVQHLRGARQRHRQGRGRHRGRDAPAAALRNTTGLHPHHAIRRTAAGRHGSAGADTGLLPARGADVPQRELPHQRLAT